MSKALQIDKAVDGNLKPVKDSDGTLTALEISTDDVRVKALDVNGDIKSPSLKADEGGDVTIGNGITSGTTVTGSLTVNGSQIITADAAVMSLGGTLSFTNHDITVDGAKKIYFDGSGDTYITMSSSDYLEIVVGGDTLISLDENGADGNIISFGATSVGFLRREQTFSTTDVKGTGGSHDTDIDFRHSNKFRLELTDDINQMNLIFPSVSGNFLLVCRTNGDHDVTTWKVWENDETAATTTDVMWAGGSVPAFTDNGTDIVSFYWDATDQQCYGTASLAFATP